MTRLVYCDIIPTKCVAKKKRMRSGLDSIANDEIKCGKCAKAVNESHSHNCEECNSDCCSSCFLPWDELCKKCKDKKVQTELPDEMVLSDNDNQ